MGLTLHAVIGTGEASAKIINQGLKEVLNKGDHLGVVWTDDDSMTKADEAVFDYILANEVPFIIFYKEGQSPGRLFRESAYGVVQKVRDPYKAVLAAVEGGGTVLFRWSDDENSDTDPDNSLIEYVFGFLGDDQLVLELTNGLAPISSVPPVPIPVPVEEEEEEEEEEDALDDFTKEELESMPATQVKQWGARRGLKATTKAGVIAELFPDVEEEEEKPARRKLDPLPPDIEPEEAPNVGAAPESDSEAAHAMRQAATWLIRAANALDA